MKVQIICLQGNKEAYSMGVIRKTKHEHCCDKYTTNIAGQKNEPKLTFEILSIETKRRRIR